MKDYSQALRFDVCLVGFGLAWDLPPFSFLFLLLGWESLPYCLSHIAFWKHIIFFYFTDSHLESNLSQNQLYLESHAHLIQVIFI